MATEAELVTVFRSMDATAKEDCEIIVEQLKAEGLSPVVVDDSTPGVPQGVYEVRVLVEEGRRAEELIEVNPLPGEVAEVDPSEDLDLETIYHGDATATAEMEALAIKDVLESNGIAAVIVGDSMLPMLGFEVRVPRDEVESAKQLLTDAQSAGPEAAEEAERETEAKTTDSPKQSH
jgi:hypothetical protein